MIHALDPLREFSFLSAVHAVLERDVQATGNRPIRKK